MFSEAQHLLSLLSLFKIGELYRIAAEEAFYVLTRTLFASLTHATPWDPLRLDSYLQTQQCKLALRLRRTQNMLKGKVAKQMSIPVKLASCNRLCQGEVALASAWQLATFPNMVCARQSLRPLAHPTRT